MKAAKRSLNALPIDGFGLQVDGKIKSEYKTSDDAMNAGLILKRKFPALQVVVFNAADQSRLPVDRPSAES